MGKRPRAENHVSSDGQGNEMTCQPIQQLVDNKYSVIISCLFLLSELPSAPKIRAGVHLPWDTSVGLSAHASPFWDLLLHLHVYEESRGHVRFLWFWGDLEEVIVRDKQPFLGDFDFLFFMHFCFYQSR